MSYIIQSDFKKSIQADNLNQVIGNDTTIQNAAILAATEEVTSYLSQKYDLSLEFQDTPLWDLTKTYQAHNRVYLNPPVFDVALNYTTGQYVSYQATGSPTINVYKSKAGSIAHTFVNSEWTFVCPQFQIFYAPYPQVLFTYSTLYNLGSQVYWKGKVYTCRKTTAPLSQEQVIQYQSISNVPYLNIAPDDLINGASNWGAGTPYTIPTNTDILNTVNWTMGDNRSQQLVSVIVDIALYILHSRIAPRNIPSLREDRYHHSIEWLKMASTGKVTPSLPTLQPLQGSRVRYGGNIKNQNSY